MSKGRAPRSRDKKGQLFGLWKRSQWGEEESSGECRDPSWALTRWWQSSWGGLRTWNRRAPESHVLHTLTIWEERASCNLICGVALGAPGSWASCRSLRLLPQNGEGHGWVMEHSKARQASESEVWYAWTRWQWRCFHRCHHGGKATLRTRQGQCQVGWTSPKSQTLSLYPKCPKSEVTPRTRRRRKSWTDCV